MSTNSKNKELLVHLTKKDFIVETFRAGGKGGQKQNKTNSGVRVKHPASGAVGESREERGQLENKHRAFKRMYETEKFQLWLRKSAAEALDTHVKAETIVEETMQKKHLVIEIKDEQGRWIKE